jgi:hypothetical protein
MTVRVAGVSNHFVLHGRDSWEGTSTLFCQQGGTTRTRRVTVTFNSYHAGFGADKASQLTLTFSISTYTDPADLQIRAFVLNHESPVEPPRWDFSSSKTSGTVSMNRVDESEIARSLQRGTLYVRGALE